MEVWLNKGNPEEGEYIARFNEKEQALIATSVKYYLGHGFFGARLTEENVNEIESEVLAFVDDEGERSFIDENDVYQTETVTSYDALRGLYNILGTYRDRKFRKPDMVVKALMLDVAQKMVIATEEQIAEEEAAASVSVVDMILDTRDKELALV